MKMYCSRLMREEKGKVLIMVLILLVVGGLILTPLLGLMQTGLIAGQVYEKKAAELYAADAGVEHAIWKIQHKQIQFDEANDYDYYHYPEPLGVNGKEVDVEIRRWRIGRVSACHVEYAYEIISTARTTEADGSSTTEVEAFLSVLYEDLDFSNLLDYAIVSDDTINIQGKSEVDGSVWLPDSGDFSPGPQVQYDPDKVKDSECTIIEWPDYPRLSDYYSFRVEGTDDPGDSIDIRSIREIGPCDRKGSLAIDNTGDPATLELTGTVYVRGDLDFEQAGGGRYTINLNGQTIFVDGGVRGAAKVRVSGSGCIIARENIDFQPGIEGDEGEFVLLLSIEGGVWSKPLGGFTGCIAGSDYVDLWPGSYIEWTDWRNRDLVFPTGEGADADPDSLPMDELSVRSWNIG